MAPKSNHVAIKDLKTRLIDEPSDTEYSDNNQAQLGRSIEVHNIHFDP